jgi:hypothetical protein
MPSKFQPKSLNPATMTNRLPNFGPKKTDGMDPWAHLASV